MGDDVPFFVLFALSSLPLGLNFFAFREVIGAFLGRKYDEIR